MAEPDADSHLSSSLLTQRQAAALLPGSRAQECRALECGLAGPPTVIGSRHMYPVATVEELGARSTIDLDELARVATGVLVLRVPKTLSADIVRDPERLAAWAAGPWRPTLMLTLLLGAVAGSRIPTVVVVGDYVCATYDTVAINRVAIERHPAGITLCLTSAGDWAAGARDRVWAIGRGGRTLRYLNLPHPHRRWWC